MSYLSMSLNKLVLIICLTVACYFGYQKYELHVTEQTDASILILTPKLNDIYFIDNGLLSGKSKRKNKYRLAKVVRVTDENIVVVYGRISYQWQSSVVNSIKFGELSNNEYFMPTPKFISLNRVKEMKNNGSIYLVKRPMGKKLYGSFIGLN